MDTNQKKTMSKTSVTINKENFIVFENEFAKIPHTEFNNLNILESLGLFERLVSLINELNCLENDMNLLCFEVSHGGYIPIKTCSNYKKVFILNSNESNNYNIIENIYDDISNIEFFNSTEKMYENSRSSSSILFINDISSEKYENLENVLVVISKFKIKEEDYITYSLTNTDFFINVKNKCHDKFLKEFDYYIFTVFDENKNPSYFLNYDNLIHLSMIVKDAGDNFENVLIKNFPFFDRWTILDTGSTDNTIDIIKKVLVGKKKGKLYQEPFVDFKTSRNRCLDLCGNESKFILVLDDTYILQNNLKLFLNTVRGDQFADTFSMFIKSNDTEYASNRILKSSSNIRYIYKIHEVLDPKDNINVIIPMDQSYIFDHRSDYMEKRTMDRKKYDLKILHEMIEEDPNDSRAYYYLGQTYSLLKKYDSALEFFLKRVDHPNEGFIQEKIDACFEAARLCNFQLNKPWEECEKLYIRSYKMDTSRPESLYFIGVHYFLNNDFTKSYEFMKKAFEIGYPIHCQYGLKPTLSFYYLPKILSQICFIVNDLKLGIEASELFLSKNENDESLDYQTVKCWNKILNKLKQYEECTLNTVPLLSSKPILVFVSDGGFSKWKGSDILSKGVGGSETFVIEMSKYIKQVNVFDVYVFCNCSEEETFENVVYLDLKNYASFLKNNKIHTCIINRYPEYLPITYNSDTSNVYLILHDLIPNGEVIIKHEKLKNVLCLTEWHKNHFISMFSDLGRITKVINYGIDKELFENRNNNEKIPYKFIYSSFAHRGLLQLLQMWPNIVSKYPESKLYIHCDIENSWLKNIRKDEMEEIKTLIEKYSSVIYKGWTSKKELAESFKTADVWLYPCTFLETFCLTALEAAISKTLVITSELGALKETVGNRGIMIGGDATTTEWQKKALDALFEVLSDKKMKNSLIEKNYLWAKKMSWKRKSNDLLQILNNEKIYIIEEEDDEISSLPYLDLKILDYFKFKTNKKPSKILEIGNVTSTKINIISTLVKSLSNSEITSITERKKMDDDNTLKNMKKIKLIETNDILSNILDNNEKYDLIILDDKFEDVLGFSIASICFKNLLAKSGMMGFIKSPMSLSNMELFIQRNKDFINILNNDRNKTVFIEKIDIF